MSEEPSRRPRPQRPNQLVTTQRTLAVVLLTIVVPIIGYLLYVQWIGPELAARQATPNTPSDIEDALFVSQLQATARAEVWATITAESSLDEETRLRNSLKATAMIEARETLVLEAAATSAAEAKQQATLAAVETQNAFTMLAMEGTVSSQVRATSNAIAEATVSAYQKNQDNLLDTYVLGTVQTLYEGDVVGVNTAANERTMTIVTSVGAFLVGGIAVLIGASYLMRPNQQRRTRQANQQFHEPSPYVTVQCACEGEKVLCHQCEGTGEVLYTDADTNRYMYRYCPRCNGIGYTDCEICSGRGQYYKETKAIDIPVEEPAPLNAAQTGWSNRVRAFFTLIDHIASNQRADS